MNEKEGNVNVPIDGRDNELFDKLEELFKKATGWYLEGFHHALSDHAKGGPGVQSLPTAGMKEKGLLDEVSSLAAQAIRFIRLPLDAALCIFDSVGLDDDTESEPKTTSRHVLGFGRTVIMGNETKHVSSSPRVSFKPDILLADPNMAPTFMIVDIKVGGRSQSLSSREVPAVAFSGIDPGKGQAMEMDACMPGEEIVLIVRNLSPQSQEFSAAIWGSLVG
jgi:hypothetical protein